MVNYGLINTMLLCFFILYLVKWDLGLFNVFKIFILGFCCPHN